jgi:hypothetical protein
MAVAAGGGGCCSGGGSGGSGLGREGLSPYYDGLTIYVWSETYLDLWSSF